MFLLFAGLDLIVANFVKPWLYGPNTGIPSLALLSIAALFPPRADDVQTVFGHAFPNSSL